MSYLYLPEDKLRTLCQTHGMRIKGKTRIELLSDISKHLKSGKLTSKGIRKRKPVMNKTVTRTRRKKATMGKKAGARRKAGVRKKADGARKKADVWKAAMTKPRGYTIHLPRTTMLRVAKKAREDPQYFK